MEMQIAGALNEEGPYEIDITWAVNKWEKNCMKWETAKEGQMEDQKMVRTFQSNKFNKVNWVKKKKSNFYFRALTTTFF